MTYRPRPLVNLSFTRSEFTSGRIDRLAFLKKRLIRLDNDINFQSCPYLDLVKAFFVNRIMNFDCMYNPLYGDTYIGDLFYIPEFKITVESPKVEHDLIHWIRDNYQVWNSMCECFNGFGEVVDFNIIGFTYVFDDRMYAYFKTLRGNKGWNQLMAYLDTSMHREHFDMINMEVPNFILHESNGSWSVGNGVSINRIEEMLQREFSRDFELRYKVFDLRLKQEVGITGNETIALKSLVRHIYDYYMTTGCCYSNFLSASEDNPVSPQSMTLIWNDTPLTVMALGVIENSPKVQQVLESTMGMHFDIFNPFDIDMEADNKSDIGCCYYRI